MTSKTVSVTSVKVFGTGSKEAFLGLRKSALTRTIKASRKLPAGAGKFPQVTCGNLRQSLPAEIFYASAGNFASGTGTAAIAGNFALASFTVYFWLPDDGDTHTFVLYKTPTVLLCNIRNLRVIDKSEKTPITELKIFLSEIFFNGK